MNEARVNRAAGPNRLLPIGVVAFAVLAVSHGAIFARVAAAPALAIAAWRLTIAAGIVALILPWHWRTLRLIATRSAGLATLGASLCLALHFATWITSLNYTSVSNSVILVNTSPIWVALLGRLSQTDRLSVRTLAAIALAVVGAAIIGFGGTRGVEGSVRGDLLALAGGAALGGYLVFARVARLQLPLVPYLFCCYTSAAIVLWVLALGSGAAMGGYSQATWMALIGVAVISQSLGHSSYNWALRFLRPSTVSVTLLGEGVIGSALAFMYFGEAVPRATWIGGPLVLAATWLATSAERKDTPEPPRK
jgi:drug/metabolite transporter (DMT)-like permease